MPLPEHARCIACHYPLRGLGAPRCPECGLGFDPDDVSTVNLGRVPGRVGRLLLRRTGWPPAILALAAAVALLITSGPPRLVPWRIADTLYLADYRHRADRLRSGIDAAYVAGVGVALAAAAYVMLHAAARVIAERRYARRNPAPRLRRARLTILLLAWVTAAATVLHGWPTRVTRIWLAAATPAPAPWASAWYTRATPRNACPVPLAPADQLTALRVAATSHFQSRAARVAALGLFVQEFPQEAVAALEATIAAEPDAEFRAVAVHVASLCHRGETARLFRSLLDDPAPVVRAAAADAIDILRGPGLTRPEAEWGVALPQVIADPPIGVAALIPEDYPPPAHSPVAFDPGTRDALERMMTTGATPDERQAAARALVNWPPATYALRVAEWGVWIATPAGELSLPKSILEEIPPFVHRIGNPYASLGDRYPAYYGAVTKPIVHFTADRPLALDMEVLIHRGRPWLAYPKPDDLAASDRYVPDPNDPFGRNRRSGIIVEGLDNAALPVMPDLREGYPWLNPPHRPHLIDPRTGAHGRIRATRLGLRWQSLIVLPQAAAWMTAPVVPGDSKFNWWSALRGVPSSYVSSRDESERFLYYDGPTRARPPYVASLKGNALELRSTPGLRDRPTGYGDERPRLQQSASTENSKCEAFFIRVVAGRPGAIRFDIAEGKGGEWKLPDLLPLDADHAVPAFQNMLTDYGLTPEESAGLVAAWRHQFFETDGQRLLLRLSAPDYDALCPLSIRPPPTTLVRLGLVLTEF